MTTAHTPKTKLVSMNTGNLHEAVSMCEKFGWADFFVAYSGSGGSGVMALRVPIDWDCDAYGPKVADGYGTGGKKG